MSKLKFFITIITLTIVDQLSKAWIVSHKDSLPSTVINNILKFTYCENRGIAFGVASGHVAVFSILTLIILVAIVVLVCNNFKKIQGLLSVGTAILIAGGFGNFIDRAFRLYVIDFIDFGELINFPIFNIADICVVLGVILIGVACIINCRREKIEEDCC